MSRAKDLSILFFFKKKNLLVSLAFLFFFLISAHFFFFSDLFIYFWPCWVFVAAHGLSLGVGSRDYSLITVHGLSSCCVQASHCGGFSCCRVWALGT